MDESKTFCFVCVGEGKISFPSNLLGSLWLGPWLAKDRLTKGKHTSLFNFLMKPPMSCKAHVLGDTGSFIRIWRHKWSEVAQSCPTLCDPMDCSPPGLPVNGIFQARVLEQGAISSSRGSSRPRNRTQVSHIIGRHTLYPLSHQGSHLMMLWCKAVANKTCYTENLNTAIFLGGHSLPETGHPALCLCLIVQTS